MSQDIVIVEDEDDVAESIREMVETLGHHSVGVVGSADDAIHFVRDNDSDLVLMDILLGGNQNGIEAAREIRGFSDVPVLFITGVDDKHIHEELGAFPDSPVLFKPVDLDKLDKTIQNTASKLEVQDDSGDKRIALLEDDEGDVRLIERYCESIDSMDIELIHFTDSESLIDTCEEQTFDLLLLDFYLSESTAIDVLDRLETHRIQIPTVVLTGRGDEDLASKVLRSGADDYRSKNELDPSELLRAILYVTRKFNHEKTMMKMAQEDELTGLFSRQHFMQRFEEELHRVTRYDETLSFVLVDLDHFKPINDNHGHITGDYVLSKISSIIENTIRSSDFAGRYGGDEIAILLTETYSDGARVMAHRISEKINNHTFESPNGHTVSLTVSIGLVEFDGSTAQAITGDDSQKIIDEADRALYVAKQKGEGLVERRKAPRNPVTEISVTVQDGDQTIEGRLLDYSAEGARI